MTTRLLRKGLACSSDSWKLKRSSTSNFRSVRLETKGYELMEKSGRYGARQQVTSGTTWG